MPTHRRGAPPATPAGSKGTNYSTNLAHRNGAEFPEDSKNRQLDGTVKMLSVMLTKGLVKRDEDSSPQIYRAAMTRERAAKKFLREALLPSRR